MPSPILLPGKPFLPSGPFQNPPPPKEASQVSLFAGCPPILNAYLPLQPLGGADQFCFPLLFLAVSEAPRSCIAHGAWHLGPSQHTQSKYILVQRELPHGIRLREEFVRLEAVPS